MWRIPKPSPISPIAHRTITRRRRNRRNNAHKSDSHSRVIRFFCRDSQSHKCFCRPEHCTHTFSTTAYWEATKAESHQHKPRSSESEQRLNPQVIFLRGMIHWWHDLPISSSHSDGSLDYLWIINAISNCPISPIPPLLNSHCLWLIP